ncbi:MAG: membrane protease subunit HflK [Saprospiraceae bacterium]|jgi:membrane protease subunit HflK
MPWNEPGSGGDKDPNDPWGKRKGQQQGPPDLDQVFRDAKERLSKSFGGGGGGSRGGNDSSGQTPGAGLNTGMIVVASIVALGFWLFSGFYKVNQGEQGVELRFGQENRTTGAGLHWRFPSPIDSVNVINIQNVNTVEVGYRSRGGTVPKEALMLTEDENIIDIAFAVQFDIKSPTDLLFNVGDSVEVVVRQATESAVREIVGHNSMDFAITEGRAQIAAETKVLLQQILDRYETGINIRSVEMQNAQPPSQVKDAFDDAVRAREDEQRLINLAEAYANDIIPRSRGMAARIKEEADGYKASIIADAQGEAGRFDLVRAEYEKAPVVTRDRMYIDAMQSVLSNTSKMVIDQSSSNNVMYLPLDKMIQNATGNSGSTSARQSGSAGQGSSANQLGDFNGDNSARSGRSTTRSTIR